METLWEWYCRLLMRGARMENAEPTKSNVIMIEFYLESGFSNQPYRWRAKARNGEIVATGESHSSLHDAMRAATAVFPDVAAWQDSTGGGHTVERDSDAS